MRWGGPAQGGWTDAWPAGYAEGLRQLDSPPGVTLHRPPALYDMRQLWKAQLPDLPGHLRAVLALWVEGTRLALNGCQDTVTLALAHGLRGPRQSAHVAPLAAGAAV